MWKTATRVPLHGLHDVVLVLAGRERRLAGALHRLPVAEPGVGGGLHGEAHRQRRQPPAARRLLAARRRGERLGEVAALVVERAELQVDDAPRSSRAPSDSAMRRASRRRSGDSDVEHVDRAELLQRPHPPQAEPGRGGDVVGLRERGLGLRHVAAPLGPADHLERLALHRRSARSAGRPSRAAVARATAVSRSLRPMAACAARASARARRAGSDAVSVRAAVACSSAASQRPGAELGRAQHEVDVGTLGRVGPGGEQRGGRARRPARSGRTARTPAAAPRRRRPAIAREPVSRACPARLSAEAREPSSSARRALRSHRSAARSRSPATAASPAARGPSSPSSSGAAVVERVERAAGEASLLGGDGGGHDGVAGQGVAEPEAGPLHVHQLRLHRQAQELGRLVLGHPGRGGREASSRSAGRGGPPP